MQVSENQENFTKKTKESKIIISLDEDLYDNKNYRIGTWHNSKSPLQNSLNYIYAVRPELTELANFILPRMPRLLLSSNTLKTDDPYSSYKLMNYSIKQKWMGVQSKLKEYVNMIIVDCDRDGWKDRLKALSERGVPMPNFIVKSPVSNTKEFETGHLYWVLKFPVNTDSIKAYDLFERLRNALIIELDGDKACGGHLGKNPFHKDFITEVLSLEPVVFKDLLKPMIEWNGADKYVLGNRTYGRDSDGAYKAFKFSKNGNQIEEEDMSQWGKLFNARFTIYKNKARDYQSIFNIVEEHAKTVNSRASANDIKDTAKSIHKFMINKYLCNSQRPNIDHGVMTRENIKDWSLLSVKEKRASAARRSSAIKAEKTRIKIYNEVENLLRNNKVITRLSLANAVGLTERRIRMLWDDNTYLQPKTPLETQSYQSLSAVVGGFGFENLRNLREISNYSIVRFDRFKFDELEIKRFQEMVVALRKRGSVAKDIPTIDTSSACDELKQIYLKVEEINQNLQIRARVKIMTIKREERRKLKLEMFSEWARNNEHEKFEEFIQMVNNNFYNPLICIFKITKENQEEMEQLHTWKMLRHRRDWRNVVKEINSNNT